MAKKAAQSQPAESTSAQSNSSTPSATLTSTLPLEHTKSARTRRGPSPVVKYWLVLYNLLSTLGWGYILVQTVVHLLDLDGSATAVATNSQSAGTLSQLIKSLPFVKSSPYLKAALGLEKHLPAALVPLYRRAATTYARVGVVTTAVQTCALLEVVHAALGWVRSPIQTTAMQVASRLMLVWGITEQFPESRTNPLFASMVFAWSFTEVIRYSFYALNLLGMESDFLTYLRYTTFYVLYPLGAGSEAFLMYSTLPKSSPIPSFQSWTKGLWKPTDYVRGALFLIWWPGLYVMYTYMIKQRRKVLSPSAGKRLDGKKAIKEL